MASVDRDRFLEEGYLVVKEAVPRDKLEQVRAASSEAQDDSSEGDTGKSGQREKTARDFVEQYRDLVD